MQMNIVIYILTKSCEYASVFLICSSCVQRMQMLKKHEDPEIDISIVACVASYSEVIFFWFFQQSNFFNNLLLLYIKYVGIFLKFCKKIMYSPPVFNNIFFYSLVWTRWFRVVGVRICSFQMMLQLPFWRLI